MKKLFIFLSLLLGSITCFAQADYKVIFDITSKTPEAQQTVIRQVNGIIKENPNAQLEVAVYGDALDMVLKDKSTVAPALSELISGHKNVSFKVCGATMKRNNKTSAELIPGVQVVPDAIYEIITKQREGWGYIKVAH
ncbi:DsrE family protein [Chitinophaga qingshengii]|uniref:DsrE family protein n=1 Tax=Chitinophaga qingshengii TaxID=1569794 RepID=A0ABR7TME9_9BACT|nr:DsrE family protein [Chitinophaga qingshengii]MBC9930584.1 DsrE family protein [Chitinophaga qingshengii]